MSTIALPPPAGGTEAPEALAPPPGNPRFPLMDSLRAIAAFGVLFSHVFGSTGVSAAHGPLFHNLGLGVTVFFVLSGFLLFRPFFSASLGAAPTPRIRDFSRRRLLRIVPAYWVALTLLAIYPGLPGVFTHDWWRYYGFLQIYNPFVAAGGLSVAWSLCVEMLFYALLPIYAIVTIRATRSLDARGKVTVQLVLLGALGLASIVVQATDQDQVVQLGLLSHFYWFAIGMALAVLSAYLHARPSLPAGLAVLARRPGMCWVAAAVVYVAMCGVLQTSPTQLHYAPGYTSCRYVASGILACLLVLPAVFGDPEEGWPRRVLAWKPLVWLGLVSYAIYLWHLSVIESLVNHGVTSWSLVLVTGSGLAVAIAAVSYYVVERPILKLKGTRRDVVGGVRR